MTEQEFHEETWVYGGRRMPTKGATANHIWYPLVDGKPGDPLLYGSKGSATVVGGLYRIPVARVDGGVSAQFGLKEYEGVKYDDVALIGQWESQDQHTMKRLARGTVERRHAKDSELDRAIEPLIRMARTSSSRNEVYALADLVRQKIIDGYYER